MFKFKLANRSIALFSQTLLLIGCGESAIPQLVENGYPTQARVEYVMQCMQKNGGQTYDTLYPCVCSIDKIAAQMPYADYAEAVTFSYMRGAPGEAGGVFRDPPRSKQLRSQLKEVEALAKKGCFVKPKPVDPS